MMKRSFLRLPNWVHCQIVDKSRAQDLSQTFRHGYTSRVDIGENKVISPGELQDRVDNWVRSFSKRFNTVKGGKVFGRDMQPVKVVKAGGQYIVTGDLSGGYVKADHKFGNRVTGITGVHHRQGIKWIGDE